jgi:hypothetical protein
VDNVQVTILVSCVHLSSKDEVFSLDKMNIVPEDYASFLHPLMNAFSIDVKLLLLFSLNFM